ncbi:hypothetical protein ACIPSE_14555 [Streptomyces sp. NPDC090106]|uniref:hypothetical protein n=1 Tax=Streptomyces sp. NPDC090106 TaxID=3365946 RepID=UPI0037F55D63
MAKTGYGKRPAGDEDPHAETDFAHLSPREREIAVFVDHLEEGHAMGYKAIAAAHPMYGQQAVRSAMGRITLAGHLRWIKEHITVEDNSMRWVTRTYWSRTPRSPEWWADFVRDRDGKDVTEDHLPGLARAEDRPSEPDEPLAEEPSEAYRTLADVQSVDSRMPLSEQDCQNLEHLVVRWLDLGATPQEITQALTDGLPSVVSNPGGLARTRLETKMPPKKAKIRQKPARRARVTRALMACGLCDADERTAEIVNGLCGECLALVEADGPVYVHQNPVPRTFLPAQRDGGALPGADEVIDVTDRVDALRRAAGLL